MISSLPLFSIETNRSSRLRPMELDASHLAVAAWFDLGPVTAIEIAEKPNALSTIYRCRTLDGVFGLRHAAEPADLIEARGHIAERVPQGFIRLRRGRTGFAYPDGPGTWSCYPWLEGTCWDGMSPPFVDMIHAALDFLAALSQSAPVPSALDIGRPARPPSGWTDRFERLAAGNRTDGSPFFGVLSTTAQSVVAWSIQELPTILAAQIASSGERRLVHNDLNHTNILVDFTGTITALDIEDISVDDVRFALAHAAFKILRHAVYVDSAQFELVCRWAATRLGEVVNARMGPIFTRGEELFYFAAAGAISDVCACVDHVSRGEQVWRLYDLEKRIHNIAEAALLFGCAANLDEITRLPRRPGPTVEL